ncbi:MAG: hypothetical protein ABIA78_04440 [archaeon]
MKKEDTALLNQLVESLEQSVKKLEEAYSQRNYDKFNVVKKFALSIQKKISEVLNE